MRWKLTAPSMSEIDVNSAAEKVVVLSVPVCLWRTRFGFADPLTGLGVSILGFLSAWIRQKTISYL